MTGTRFVSASLVAALLVSVTPLPAGASESTRATTLRASIDRAVAQVAAVRDSPPPGFTRPEDRVSKRAGTGQMGGGGGRKFMMAYVVVGLAASAAGTYFVVKEMRKAQGQ